MDLPVGLPRAAQVIPRLHLLGQQIRHLVRQLQCLRDHPVECAVAQPRRQPIDRHDTPGQDTFLFCGLKDGIDHPVAPVIPLQRAVKKVRLAIFQLTVQVWLVKKC